MRSQPPPASGVPLLTELAPAHKIGLTLNSPLMAGGGLGFADEYAALIDFARLGAFITNPLTLRPRPPAENSCVLPYPGGVLIHTGLPNPGLTAAVREYERRWARMPCAVIVHLAATTVEETVSGVEKLERVESVAGIEIGFRDDESLADAEAIMRAAAQRARQPVIASLPQARAAAFARAAERAGVQAVTVAAPLRGEARMEERWVAGRLYGPALLPQTLRLVREIKQQASLPIIGAGGVHTQADFEAVLAAGAVAVLVDSAAWVAPAAAAIQPKRSQ